METWTSRWWEATVVVLAANSVFFGVIAVELFSERVGKDYTEWGIALGFVPAALLITGLALRNTWRAGATAMMIAGSLLAAGAFWWMIYPVVLAALVIIGGLSNAKIGPRQVQSLAPL